MFSDKSLFETNISNFISFVLVEFPIGDVLGILKINRRLYSLCRVITSVLNCRTLCCDTLMLPGQQKRLLSHLSIRRIPCWRQSFFVGLSPEAASQKAIEIRRRQCVKRETACRLIHVARSEVGQRSEQEEEAET